MSEKKVYLKIIGMSCEHCEKAVTGALLKVEGVQNAKADHRGGAAEVTYDDEKATQEQLVKAVNDLEVYEVQSVQA